MKRLLGLAGLGALIAVLGIFAAIALAGGDVIYGGQDQTICHATGSEDGGNQHNGYNIETVSVNSIVKESGHGSHTSIGGKSDVIPAFDYTKTVKGQGQDPDVTTNEHYDGLGGGDISVCKGEEPPPEEETGKLIVVKVVVNDDGGTKTASDFSFTVDSQSYAFESDGSNSVTLPVGDHTVGEVAATGYTSSISDTSVKIKSGKIVLVRIRNDDVKSEEPTDVCPNITGDQAEIPAGMVKDAQGNCVTPPPHEVKGDASVSCILPDGYYRVSGTVDGHAADDVSPATIPGNAKGAREVIVTRGDTSVKTTVSTNGDCGNAPRPPEVTPPVETTAPVQTVPTPPTTTTEPTAPLTPPTTKPAAKKPAVKKPAAKPAPAAPKKAVAGAFAKEPPKLAYTP